MSEQNKRLVRRALEGIYTKGDLELANELVHPDFVDHEPAHAEQPTGPASVSQTVRRLQSTFGDLRFEVEDEIAEGDKVVQGSPSDTSTSGGSPTARSSSTGGVATTSACLGSSGSCRWVRTEAGWSRGSCMSGRSRYAVVLTEEERSELESRAARYTLPHKHVQRAKLVLYAAEGLTNVEIGARLEITPKVVGRWRRRFCEERLDGLEDRARSGRPRRFLPGGRRPGEGGGLRAAVRGRAALAPLGG